MSPASLVWKLLLEFAHSCVCLRPGEVADWNEDKLYACDPEGKTRLSAEEFNGPKALGNSAKNTRPLPRRK